MTVAGRAGGSPFDVIVTVPPEQGVLVVGRGAVRRAAVDLFSDVDTPSWSSSRSETP
jgi:hypothetical protein